MRLSRRTLLAATAGAAAIGAPAWRAAADDSQFVVNTYGGRWVTFWRDRLVPKLEPVVKLPIRVDVGLGTAWAAGFRAAGKQAPPLPCLMTNERYAVSLRDEGYFTPLPAAKIPNLADVVKVARYPNDAAVTGMISPFGIAYRKDLVKTPPKSWRDLWNPEYKGQLGFYAIDNSAAIMMVMLAGKLFGSGEQDIETGVSRIAQLKPFPQAAFSGQLSPLFAQGQIAIAPIDYAEAYALQKKGVPMELVVPEDGVLMYDQSFNIAAGGTQQALAADYLNFILDPEIQLMLAREFFVAPVNRKVVVPEDLRGPIPVSGDGLDSILRFDWAFAAKNSDRIAKLWAQQI
jgi:putative spermidine/putrescine transport system substrate-binding protein